jgi:hypothetical protein
MSAQVRSYAEVQNEILEVKQEVAKPGSYLCLCFAE